MAPSSRWREQGRGDRGGGGGGGASGASGGGGEFVVVVWHRWSDLRLSDHEPLVRAHRRAAQSPGGRVLHLHLVERDPLVGSSRVSGIPRCSSRRAAFWRESAEDLAARLESRGQLLWACADAPGGPGPAFGRLCAKLPVRAVFAHQSFSDEEIQTDAEVRAALAQHGASLEVCWGGLTVHHIGDLGFDATDRREMPEFEGMFQRAVKGRLVRAPLPVPTALCPPPSVACLEDLGSAGRDGVARAFAALGAPLRWEPPPAGLGRPQRTSWDGGETAALRHLEEFVWESDGLLRYKGATESFNHGDDNAVNAGSRLSPWLAFGCLSARTVIAEVRSYERKHGKPGGKGPGRTSTTYRLYKELIFRDFLRFSALSWGSSLFKIRGPFGVTGLEWRRDSELFERWRAGRTGFPFVDAGMRELAATGFISHLHRQCCAAFLVRDLRIDWRMGAEHFEACLVDYTPDANWGNWAYRILPRPCLVAAGCPVREHCTTLEILAWPVVHDPHLEHTLAWLPELRGLPLDLAREPWRTESQVGRRVVVKQYRDTPLWFCSANRVNWQYEYAWLPGHAWTVAMKPAGSSPPAKSAAAGSDFALGSDYPRPMVPPLNIEVDLDRLPVSHSWGDTPAAERPHVWGRSGRPALEGQGQRQGKRQRQGQAQAQSRGQSQGQCQGEGGAADAPARVVFLAEEPAGAPEPEDGPEGGLTYYQAPASRRWTGGRPRRRWVARGGSV